MEVADCVFLAAVSLASSAWYLARLGFYSDDWGLIAAFSLAPDPSVGALVRASFVDRPAQGVYSILLFRLFGTHPLGYHVANAVVLAAVSVLLYLVVRELCLSRVAALAIGLVYVLLPNYSTDRFWFAAFAAPLSIAFYLASLLSDLSAVDRTGVSRLARRGFSLGALLISVLSYEAAMPLFLLNPFLRRKMGSDPIFTKNVNRGDLGANVAVLAAVALYKAETSPRLHAPQGVPALIWSIATNLLRPGFRNGQYGLNLRAAFDVNYGAYLFRLPATVWSLQHQYPLAGLPLLSVIFGLGTFLYLRSIGFDLMRRQCVTLIAIGGAVFLAGYSMFLTNKAIQITPTGIGNRTSIAAALGVAISATGVLGLLAGLVSRADQQRTAFAVLLSAYLAGCFFVISTLSSFWISAFDRELEIARDIEAHIPAFPPKTTLMLGGICSYHGPAIIFESDWDLSGLLRLHYGDRTLSADVLRPGSYSLTPTGIATILYEGEDDYDFGSYLRLYDYNRKTTQALTDLDTAKEIFRKRSPDVHCPPGMEGVGSPIL